MLPCPKLSAKKIGELASLARDIPRYPGAPAKEKELLAAFNALSGLALEVWQFNVAVFWPSELRTFVECALSHLESPEAPSMADALTWIRELRERNARMADVHHTLRSLERLSPRPDDVARLVFFTEGPPAEVLAAMTDGEANLTKQLLVAGESTIDLGDVDAEEVASLVALADQGIDCADRGDRDGLKRAARALAKRTGQRIEDDELRALPSAMDTEPWVRGLLLARDLLRLETLTWSRFRHAVGRYVTSIETLRDSETAAFEKLLDASTPYPHARIHYEMRGSTTEELERTSREITRHMAPWGDAPAPPEAVTVDGVWRTARSWAEVREAKDWSAAAGLRRALEKELDQANVPALRALLSMPDAERRAQMRALGLLPPGELAERHGTAAAASEGARQPSKTTPE